MVKRSVTCASEGSGASGIWAVISIGRLKAMMLLGASDRSAGLSSSSISRTDTETFWPE